MAKLDPNQYRVKEYPEKATLSDALALLFNNQDEPVTKAKPDILTQEYLSLKSDLKLLQDFNDPAGVYARLPLGWNIR